MVEDKYKVPKRDCAAEQLKVLKFQKYSSIIAIAGPIIGATYPVAPYFASAIIFVCAAGGGFFFLQAKKKIDYLKSKYDLK